MKLHPRHVDIYEYLKEMGDGEMPMHRIIGDLGCKRKTIQNAIKKLTAVGLLEVSRRHKGSPYYYRCHEIND